MFVRECHSRGLIIYPGGIAPLNNAAIICPPLVITEAETALLLHKLDGALEAMDEHIEQWAAADSSC